MTREKGMTLIALVITIIVLLILVGVSIATLTGDNGIITQVNNSKIETVIGTVKEQLKLLQTEKRIGKEKLTPETLLAEGKAMRRVKVGGNDKYYMYYALKEDSFEGMQGLGKGDLTSMEDVFLIDDDLNVKYIARSRKEYGDEIKDKILEDETEIRFSSKAFSEYISKISGVSENELKFKWMKNQTSLRIIDSSIDTLNDLVFFPNLTSLIIGDENGNCPAISTLDGVENCLELTSISIIGGIDKEYMELVNLPNLKSFTRKYGKNDYDNIIDALKLCNRIENVEITNSYAINSMQRIGELKDLKSLSMYSNQISKIEGLENKKSLHTLNLLGNKISKIEGIENLESLHTLNLTKNQIIDITPLEKNTSLMRLELKQNVGIDGNRNNYTEEQLKALDKIGEILDRNGRINIDIDKIGLFKNYKNLDLSGQKMDTLEPLEGLTQLEILSLKDNQLTLEDKKSQEILMKMTNLVNLNICNNKITNIKIINNLKNLKTLALKGNKIDLKEIEDIISNLESLEISTENLKTIINCDVNKITKLSIGYYSYINELPDLSKFNKLIELNLYNNSGIINFNLLSELSSLKTLNLKACNLHERMPDFSKLINLTNLDLSDNILWSNDLESLKSLKNNKNLTINLQNNSIVDARALLELDKSCKIYLQNNKNLTQESKDDLKERFGSNVIF